MVQKLDYRQIVSIIMPTYNAEKYIESSIESVLNQDFADFELVIVDDCSSDNTCSLINKYADLDERIKKNFLRINSGPAVARNVGLANAHGRWIAFLDCDDLWHPEKLSQSLFFLKKKTTPFIYTSYRRFTADLENIGRIISVPNRITYEELLSNTAIVTSTVVIDRELTGNFQMKHVFYDDFACWLELLKNFGPAYGLNSELTYYRVSKGSFSHNKFRSATKVFQQYIYVEKLPYHKAFYHFFFYSFRAIFKYAKF